MKLLSIIFAMTIAIQPAFAAKKTIKVKYIQDVMAHATASEKTDVKKLLEQIQVVPTKAKYKGKPIFKVQNVEKNSVYERAGIKKGDLVLNGSSPKTMKK